MNPPPPHATLTRTVLLVLQLLCTTLALAAAAPAAPAPFRTDGGDDKAPWFQPQPGEFPPEGSAHYIAGELVALDHVNRTGVLRPDRTDAIGRGQWDIPLPFTLLPYGTLNFRGAPAELRDIPIGTHLHGQFYLADKAGKNPKGPFERVLRFEDDFSYFTRLQRAWRIDAVDLEKNTLTVTGTGPAGKPADAKPTIFIVNPTTRIWKGRAIGTLADLAAGQSVLVNLTVCTLKGPGRCTDIWLDAESRAVASAHQLEVHRQYQREHGLAGWVEDVDNQKGLVTVTLFGVVDPKLKSELLATNSMAAAVAGESLRTYDQISDRMRGEVITVKDLAPGPGNSGVRVQFKPTFLLEGFRPKRIVRVFAGGWKVDDLPKEERLYQ